MHNSYNVTERSVAPISSSTTWNNQPDLYTASDTVAVAGSYGSCPDRVVDFDVTSSIAADGNGVVTFRLHTSETNRNAFKRFANSATLTVKYNSPPNVPTNLVATPTPRNPTGQSCGDNNPANNGWIGKTTSGVTFASKVSDPDGTQQNIQARLHLWDKGLSGVLGNPGEGAATTVVYFTDSAARGTWVNASASTGGTSTTNPLPDSSFKDGHKYGWDMDTFDGIDDSAQSVHCYFWRDLSSPPAPTASYNAATTQLTLTAADPIPSGGTSINASGIDYFRYSTDPTDLPSGIDYFRYSTDPTDLPSGGTLVNSSGSATFTYTPPDWGTNYLYIIAVDNAGNASTTKTFQYYQPQNPDQEVHPGDVDGDGHPHLLYATTTGALNLERVTGNKSKVLASNAVDSPNGSTGGTWNDTGVHIAHRSSLARSATAGFKDDLWANLAADLYLYRNTGASPYYTKSGTNAIPITHPFACTSPGCEANYNTDWSGVTQLVAPGDITGDDIPDLITTETSSADSRLHLWLYPGSPVSGQLGFAIQLGNLDWTNYTIIAPAESGTTTNEIWGRQRNTGVLYSYTYTVDAASGTVTIDDPTTRDQIGSGFTEAGFPRMTSLGDVDGNGKSDIYVTTSGGEFTAYMGTSTTGSNRFDTGHVIDTTGWTGITTIG